MTYSVSTGGHAIHRTVEGVLERFTDPVATGRRTVCRTTLEGFAVGTHPIATAEAIRRAGIHAVRVLTHPVSAHGKTVMGT
jgi:hypothetical protein